MKEEIYLDKVVKEWSFLIKYFSRDLEYEKELVMLRLEAAIQGLDGCFE